MTRRQRWFIPIGMIILVVLGLFLLDRIEKQDFEVSRDISPEQSEWAQQDEGRKTLRDQEKIRLPPPPDIATRKRVSPAQLVEGYRLLTHAEEGQGVAFVLHWPAEPDERVRLFDAFRYCFGAVPVVIADGRIKRRTGGQWQVWTPDRRYFSGLIRDISEVDHLRAHGFDGMSGAVGLIFSRQVDARTLGGLSGWLEEGQEILHARYGLEGGHVLLHPVDGNGGGKPVIDLGAGRC